MKKAFPRTFLATLFALTLVAAVPSNVAAQTAGACKWYTGHYLKGNLGDVRNEPGFVGYRREVHWRQLETAEGVYTTRQLGAELDAAQAAGKKVMLMVVNNQYGAARTLPDYLYTNKYGGGVYRQTSNSLGAEYYPMLYRKDMSDRFVKLIGALGSLDGHPALALIQYSELLIYPAPAPGKSNAQLFENLKDWADASAAAFKFTPTTMMMNFGLGGYQQEAAAHVADVAKIGFSDPDMTRTPAQGCGRIDVTGNFGFVWSKYKSRAYYSAMVSRQTSGCVASPQAALAMANSLGVHFLTWVNYPENWTREQQFAFVNSKAREPNGGLMAVKPANWCGNNGAIPPPDRIAMPSKVRVD